MSKLSLLVVSVLLCFSQAQAGDLLWSGQYRAEGVFIKNLRLDNNQNQETSYLMHHLVLSPKIIAMDGLNIYSRFDVFNNSLGVPNQMGQIFGSYSATTPSSVMSRGLSAETIAVNELYMNWINEFGSVIIGRVPFNFGLGMYYNDGHGMFDHYLSTKDIVAYRISMGNFFITPAYGKVREGFLNNEDDINDFFIVAEYKNPESDLELGVMYNARVAPNDGAAPTYGNDFPLTYYTGTVAYSGGLNATNINLYAKKKSEYFNMGVEVGFQNGDAGVTVNGQKVTFAGFGVAGELSYRTGSLTLDARAGLASGDDTDTPGFEGYFFSPNYNVAMLMFNHPLGQYDVLKTTAMGGRSASGTALNGIDTEMISNAIYFAPRVTWAMGEKYDLFGNFCYGITSKSPLANSAGAVGSALGFETDIGFRYHFTDKFVWETQIGVLFPGSAFAGPSTTNFKTDMSYGATSKASISF